MAARTRKRKRRHPATKAPKAKPATTPKPRERVRVAKPTPQKKAKAKAKTKTKVGKVGGSRPVKRRAPAAPSKPAPFPKRKPAAAIKPRRPAPPPVRKLSRNPEAVRSRRRRLEAKSAALGIAAAKAAKKAEQLARAKAARKKKKQLGRPLTDEERAASWLERIREHCAEVFSCALAITYPGGGHADLRDSHDQHLASQKRSHLWLAVGHYSSPDSDISYALLAEALMRVRDDLFLETRVGPDRLTQIRIVFHDPDSKRTESDSVVSKIGGYEYVISDMIGELTGSDVDNPDADSLAARYENTVVPQFYVFFSSEMVRFQKVAFGPKTQEVKLR